VSFVGGRLILVASSRRLLRSCEILVEKGFGRRALPWLATPGGMHDQFAAVPADAGFFNRGSGFSRRPDSRRQTGHASADPALQARKCRSKPFHKIVMVRNNLRVLEQRSTPRKAHRGEKVEIAAIFTRLLRS